MLEEQNEFFDSFKGVLRLNVPVSLLKDKDTKPTEIILYAIIDFLGYRNDVCWASNKTLSKMINTSERTIISTVNKLVEKGYIKREIRVYKGQTRRYLYTLEQARIIELENDREEISKKDYELANYDWLNEQPIIDDEAYEDIRNQGLLKE